MVAAPRTLEQRTRDVHVRLTEEVDAWVATAGPDGGTPYLVPLSFLWDGTTLLLATAAATPTGRNLAAGGGIRVGIGQTRDVILIDGTVEAIPTADLPSEVGDAFAAKTGFDPRTLSSPYLYFRVRPLRLQAWREENELRGRTLMRDGRWLAPDAAGVA